MSAMADLDIKLSEYKLSDAQKNAVLEVMDQGWTSAKTNTIKSLENKGILVKVSETHHNFTDEFVRESGIFGEQPEGLDREKVAQIQEIEDLSQPVGDNFTNVLGWEPDSREWRGAPSESVEASYLHITDDELAMAEEIHAVQEAMFSGGESGDVGDPSKPAKLDITREQAERFDSSLGVYYNNLLGFGEVYKWNNIKVWDGLTADEIRRDMNTAVPINREARRKGAKLTRKFIKALSKVS